MKNLNNKLNKIFNQFFILGMIISAGIIYLSEAIFKNVIFFTSINMPKTQFILGTFFVISALTYFFIIRDFDKEIWAQSIKKRIPCGSLRYNINTNFCYDRFPLIHPNRIILFQLNSSSISKHFTCTLHYH